MFSRDWVIIAGSASVELARAIAREAGVSLSPCAVERFPDGEVSVEIGASVRRRDVLIIQATSPPVNDHLVELMLLADACRRAAAAQITAIIPYFGYARSDRRRGRRAPGSARAAADLLESSGVGHVVTVDVHTPQVEGFFRIPTDDVSALGALGEALAADCPTDAVIVAPDLGAVRRARDLSRRLDLSMALCLKQRRSGSEVEVTGVVGEVAGRSCIIVDDMISTGGTVAGSANALRAAGARDIAAVAATHAVLTPGAHDVLRQAGLSRIVVSDTVSPCEKSMTGLRVVTVAPLLATVIRRLEAGESLRELG